MMNELETFLYKIKLTKSFNTYRSYKSTMKAITDNKIKLDNINEKSVLKAIELWHKTLSINTIKYRLVVLSQFCKSAGIDYVWIDNLCDSIPSEYKIQPCPTIEEFEKILGKINNYKYKAILLIMAESGARVSEVTGIKLCDLNLKNNSVVIRSTKNNEDKIIRLSNRAKENIQNYIKRERCDTSENKLFTSPFGEQAMISTQVQIKTYCEMAGLGKYHCHSFRHYFAQRLIDNNYSLPIVQKAMGHKSSKSTERYFKVKNDTVFSAVDSVFN